MSSQGTRKNRQAELERPLFVRDGPAVRESLWTDDRGRLAQASAEAAFGLAS
jgi:hypothetical protein